MRRAVRPAGGGALAVALALGLCGTANAQAPGAVAVQSGEHANFTRLALTIDPASDWQITHDQGAAYLVLTGQALQVDLSRVFDRIPRSRLADMRAVVQEGETVLVLDLACDCRVTGFGFRERFVILDIAEAPAGWTPEGSSPLTTSVPGADSGVTAGARAGNATDLESGSAVRAAARRIPVLAAPEPLGLAPAIDLLTDLDLPAPQQARPDRPVADAQRPPRRQAQDSPDTPPATTLFNLTDLEALSAPPDPHAEAAEAKLDSPSHWSNPMADSALDDILADSMAEAQMHLLQQLALAADIGLVDFPAARPEPEPAPEPEPRAEPDPAPDPAPDLSPDLRAQIESRSVYDRDQDSSLARLVQEFARPHCLPDSAFDLQAWGAPDTFVQDLGRLRAGLMQEFDQPDPAGALALVQLYVRHGFGPEALSLIRDLGLGGDQAELVQDLALIADGRSARPDGTIARGGDCGGAHQMWHVVGLGMTLMQGQEAPRAPEMILPDSVLAAFEAYPPDIRARVAPALSMGLTLVGQPDNARRVLDMIARRGEPAGAQHRLVVAQLDLGGQRHAQARADLADLALQGGPVAVDALLALAQDIALRHESAPDWLVAELETASYERQGTRQGQDLRRAMIEAAAPRDGLASALAQLGSLLGDDTDAQVLDSAARLLRRAGPGVVPGDEPEDVPSDVPASWPGDGADFDPAALALAVVSHPDLVAQVLAHDARTGHQGLDASLARGVLAAGLPAAALALLDASPWPDDPALMTIRARAHLARHDAQAALRVLGDATDAPARALRAQALALAGQHDLAYEALAPTDAQAPAMAWAAGRWADLGPDAPEWQRELALFMQVGQPGGDATARDGAGPLAQSVPGPGAIPLSLGFAADLLAQTAAARAALQALLDDKPPALAGAGG